MFTREVLSSLYARCDRNASEEYAGGTDATAPYNGTFQVGAFSHHEQSECSGSENSRVRGARTEARSLTGFSP